MNGLSESARGVTRTINKSNTPLRVANPEPSDVGGRPSLAIGRWAGAWELPGGESGVPAAPLAEPDNARGGDRKW